MARSDVPKHVRFLDRLVLTALPLAAVGSNALVNALKKKKVRLKVSLSHLTIAYLVHCESLLAGEVLLAPPTNVRPGLA